MRLCVFCECDDTDLLDVGFDESIGVIDGEAEFKACRHHSHEFGDVTVEPDGYVVVALTGEKLARRARVIVVKPRPDGKVGVRICPEAHVEGGPHQ
jgi:hypothetical protein